VAEWLSGPQFSILNVDGNASNAVAVVQGGPGGNELAQTKESFKGEILQMLGIDPRMLGDAARLTQQGSQRVPLTTPAKHEDRKRSVERFMTNIMGKLAGVAQQVSNETEIPLDDGSFADVVKTSPDILSTQAQQGGPQVAGGETAEPTPIPFVKIDEELLAGAFMFKVQIGSTSGTDEKIQEERMKSLANVVKDNPSIDQTEFIKLLLEKLNLNEFSVRLFKDPQQVKEEQEKAFQQQLELALAEPRLKTDTDLKKTEMKTDSAETVAEISAAGKEFESVRKDDRKKDEIDNELLKILSSDNDNNNERGV